MPHGTARTRVVILGAAGRDFHCFDKVHRDDPSREVVALRPQQVTTHHPGETVAHMAVPVILNELDAAPADAAQRARIPADHPLRATREMTHRALALVPIAVRGGRL